MHESSGRLLDSGEGRCTAIVAVEEVPPAPVVSAALFSCFGSRDQARSAMRKQFGRHAEKPAE